MESSIDNYKYALTIMHEQGKYAEQKNASLIIFTSALSFAVIGNIDNIKKLLIIDKFNFLLPFKENVFQISIIIFISLLFISMFISLLSFIPQVTNGHLENQNTNNLFFFFSNKCFASSSNMNHYYKKKYKKKEIIESDLCNQIINISIITNRKYTFYRYSALLLIFSPLITLIISFLIYIIV